jgi:hypothetical protein
MLVIFVTHYPINCKDYLQFANFVYKKQLAFCELCSKELQEGLMIK